MQTLPKLYLAASLIMNMAITNYCYNTYGLPPDYNFFATERAIEPVASVAPHNKAAFISNYTPLYDNVVSSMAIIDETVSTGALYIDHRKQLGSMIYLDDVQIQVPNIAKAFGKVFVLDEDVDYAGDDHAGTLFHNDKAVASVRIKNNMVYRVSSKDPAFKIDDIGVGCDIFDAVRKWGQPAVDEESTIYKYDAGENAQITLITNDSGFVTWMLYESTHTELLDENGTELTDNTDKNKKDDTKDGTAHPVADAIIKMHSDGGRK